MDYQALLYNPIYETLGVDATLITSGGDEYEITAQDRTVPTTASIQGAFEIQTFKPYALVRMAEIVGLGITVADDVLDGELTMSGRTWGIKSFEYRPAPTGINEGEVRLILDDTPNV